MREITSSFIEMKMNQMIAEGVLSKTFNIEISRYRKISYVYQINIFMSNDSLLFCTYSFKITDRKFKSLVETYNLLEYDTVTSNPTSEQEEILLTFKDFTNMVDRLISKILEESTRQTIILKTQLARVQKDNTYIIKNYLI